MARNRLRDELIEAQLAPLLDSFGYVRHGQTWESETRELCRIIRLRTKYGSDTFMFTLDVHLLVNGTEPFTGHAGRLNYASKPVVGAFLDTPGVLWWRVHQDALSTPTPVLTGTGSISTESMQHADLRFLLEHRVLPYLAKFSTVRDVLLDARELQKGYAGLPSLIAALEAISAWRAAGSPATEVTVRRMDASKVLVKIADASSLVGNPNDLASACVQRGTPYQLVWSVRDIQRIGPGEFLVHGERLDPELLSVSYTRYLSIIRFASLIPHVVNPVPRPALARALGCSRSVAADRSLTVEELDGDRVAVIVESDVGQENLLDSIETICRELHWVHGVERDGDNVLLLSVGRHSSSDLDQLRHTATSLSPPATGHA